MSANLFESLESRQLMSVSFAAGTLTITGTDARPIRNRDGVTVFFGGADNLRVELQDASTLRISDNGTVTFRERTTVQRIVMNGLTAADTLFVGSDVSIPATLNGGAGNDTIAGGAANDTLNGAEDNDVIRGSAGNDTMDGGTGADDFSGGAGADLVTYASRTAPVFVNLDNQPFDGQSGEGDRVRNDIENVTGGAGNDRLIGSDSANVFRGLGGDDIIFGRVGADSIFGGAGNDVLIGATGADQLNGEDGNDVMNGGSSNDVMSGGAGNDVMTAGSGRDVVNGDAGDDVIFAGGDQTGNNPALNDLVIGGAGLDIVELDGLDQSNATNDLIEFA